MRSMSAATGVAFGLLLGHLHATASVTPGWVLILVATALAAIGQAGEQNDSSRGER